jgi:hypothetical protein
MVARGVLRTFADDTDVIDARFGNEVYVIEPSVDEGRMGRKSNGIWWGQGGPRTTSPVCSLGELRRGAMAGSEDPVQAVAKPVARLFA